MFIQILFTFYSSIFTNTEKELTILLNFLSDDSLIVEKLINNSSLSNDGFSFFVSIAWRFMWNACNFKSKQNVPKACKFKSKGNVPTITHITVAVQSLLFELFSSPMTFTAA